ncbi:MAG: response regulator [Bacteroidia bacterium]|nr:response regulator [Bacteroidia bacterium]
MEKRLNCVMLIDDNPHDNFFHERVIRKMDCTQLILAFQSGKDALDFIRMKEVHPEAHPDLIFLDINMPGMNGWDFLDEYYNLEPELQSRVIIVMLSTSQNPDDHRKARELSLVSAFETKPLTEESLGKILQQFFPDYL